MTRSKAVSDRLFHQLDSVYFLLFPNWERELRANRWNFAVRWARHKPLVLVLPTLVDGPARSEPEPRIPNCRILRIKAVGEPDEMAIESRIQAGQILKDMAEHQFERPLFWCYNWMLAGPFAQVPAVARLLHATEAHFDVPHLSPFFPRLRGAIAVSDLTVAVSDGVAAGIRSRIDAAEIITVNNGCDFRRYSEGKPDELLAAKGGTYSRIAIYAGNINERLDFGLLHRLASEHQEALFALYGPVSALSEPDARAWKDLVARPNVMAPGVVDPDRLPDLYAAADVGIIPYRQYALLVENGLPLKALEMCATGLPVVTSLMKPLRGMAASLVVTASPDEFLNAFSNTWRGGLSQAAILELRAVSAANDYDKKFDEIVGALDERIDEARPTTRVDTLVQFLGSEWFDSEIKLSDRISARRSSRVSRRLLKAVMRRVPSPLKRRLNSNRPRGSQRDTVN